MYLSAIWLLHGQLWAIIKGAASLTQCESLRFVYNWPEGHWGWVPKLSWTSSDVWTGNFAINSQHFNPLSHPSQSTCTAAFSVKQVGQM